MSRRPDESRRAGRGSRASPRSETGQGLVARREPNPTGHRLISADSHVVEPPEVFASVTKQFGKSTPKLVHTEDRGWLLDTGLGWTFQPGWFATAGFAPQTAKYDAQERSGYTRESLTNITVRLSDMDRDGVEAEVLFPSILGSFLSGRKVGPKVTEALCRSYNDWLAGYCGEAPRRLFPLACISTGDLGVAIAEMERAKKLGHVGIVIPCGSPEDRPYIDPAYDTLWEAAQEKRMPVAFHAAFGADPVFKAGAFQRQGLRYALNYVGATITISDLIIGGVCERFPSIRFVPTEFDTGWIAHFLTRMDWRQFRRGNPGPIRMRFSDYWHRNFRTTFEDDAIGIRTRDKIGVDSLMWGSDYPHGDSVWPNSRSTLDQIMSNCTAEERHVMTVKNVSNSTGCPSKRSAHCPVG